MIRSAPEFEIPVPLRFTLLTIVFTGVIAAVSSSESGSGIGFAGPISSVAPLLTVASPVPSVPSPVSFSVPAFTLITLFCVFAFVRFRTPSPVLLMAPVFRPETMVAFISSCAPALTWISLEEFVRNANSTALALISLTFSLALVAPATTSTINFPSIRKFP